VKARVFENLVMSNQKPGAPSFRCVVLHDPKHPQPLVLVTNVPVSPRALLTLYRDRWPIEHPPLAAKQMWNIPQNCGARSRAGICAWEREPL
jgi:hypothetical protein